MTQAADTQQSVQSQTLCTGRRKTAVARLRLVHDKEPGLIVINNKPLDQYFVRLSDRMVAQQPLDRMKEQMRLDPTCTISVTVKGGGISAQAGAIRMALTRALILDHPALSKPLKAYRTRDARAVERKKVGLHKARKAPQFSKR